MDSLADLRQAVRRLLGNPGFTAIAAATLALGIGTNIAIYSVLDAALFKPLPFKDSESLYQIHSVQAGGFVIPSLGYDVFAEWRAQSDLFRQVEGFGTRAATLAGGGEPERVVGAEITAGVLGMLGAAPRLGRAIQAEHMEPGRERVVLLSDALWRRRFASDPSVVGRPLRFDDETYEIIGVMPPGFAFPRSRLDFWVPLPVRPPAPGARAPRFEALVRLHPGITLAQAQRRADALAVALEEAKPSARGWSIVLRRFLDRRVNAPEERALFVLFGAVGVVLLIACTNLANLLLVQGAGRAREVAVRAALGATRGRLVRQLLTENIVLAALGGLAGTGLALWAVDAIAAFAPREITFLNVIEIAVDQRVLAFAVALSGLTCVLFGALPALRVSAATLHDSLKAGARGSAGGRQQRLRGAFVVVQVALSVVLLVGAALFVRTLIQLTRVDPGFEPRNLVAVDLSPPRWRYPTREAQQQMLDRMVDALRRRPGVRAATVTHGIPPDGAGVSFGMRFEPEGGRPLEQPDLLVSSNEVGPDYFDVLKIPIRAGRTFTADDRRGAPRVIIVNDALARLLWPELNPVGRRLRLRRDGTWYTVVGVAGNVFEVDRAQQGRMPAVYYPIAQNAGIPAQQTLVIRTEGPPAAAIPGIKESIWSVDKDQSITKLATAEELYGEFFATPRFYAVLMAAFAALGLVMAAVGLYGVLAYAMAQRTREFGIRLALGARPGDVRRLIAGQAVRLTGAGLVLGMAASLAVTRAFATLLFDGRPTHPSTYAAVTVVLAVSASAAAWMPARRATRVDPAVTLRSE
jgi:predicted permease